MLDWILSLQWAGLMPGTLLHLMVMGKIGLQDQNYPVILAESFLESKDVLLEARLS